MGGGGGLEGAEDREGGGGGFNCNTAHPKWSQKQDRKKQKQFSALPSVNVPPLARLVFTRPTSHVQTPGSPGGTALRFGIWNVCLTPTLRCHQRAKTINHKVPAYVFPQFRAVCCRLDSICQVGCHLLSRLSRRVCVVSL